MKQLKRILSAIRQITARNSFACARRCITKDTVRVIKDVGDIGLMKHGRPYCKATLNTGWDASCFVSVGGILGLLILTHKNGKDAIWYFDGLNNYIGNKASDVLRFDGINKAVLLLTGDILRPLFFSARYASHLTKSLSQYNSFIDELLHLIELVDKKDLAANSVSDGFELDIKKILDTEGKDSQDAYIGAAGKPPISLSIGGDEYLGQHSIILGDMLVAYPVVSRRGSVLVLFEAQHYSKRVAIFHPDLGVIYKNGNKCASRDVLSKLIIHFWRHHDALRKYLSAPAAKKVGMIRSGHIGHNLWNELTALYRLRVNGLLNCLSELILFDGARCEPWIALEDLFGGAALRVNRQIHNLPGLIEYVYSNRLFLIRLGDERIPKALVQQILLNNVRACGDVNTKYADELRVVFGLRCENRTWVNQTEGLIELAKYLQGKTKRLTIIVDGHDLIRSTGSLHSSFAEKDDHNVLGMERQIVASLAMALKNSSVKLIDAVGMSLECSLAWIDSSDFFVAPWGAGLAKYKWISNLPGVIFTSRTNLEHRSDLHIYENTFFREGATACIYVPAEFVEDLVCDESLVSVSGAPRSRANFFVKTEGIKMGIDKLLSSNGAVPQTQDFVAKP